MCVCVGKCVRVYECEIVYVRAYMCCFFGRFFVGFDGSVSWKVRLCFLFVSAAHPNCAALTSPRNALHFLTYFLELSNCRLHRCQ